jgi:hypothetical protein
MKEILHYKPEHAPLIVNSLFKLPTTSGAFYSIRWFFRQGYNDGLDFLFSLSRHIINK